MDAATVSQPLHGIKMQFDVPIPMRDGIRLSGDLYFPDAPGPFPVILTRTPYDNSAQRFVDWARFYARRGYAFVAQDCRGRYDSEGVFYAWHDEARDGYDTQEWIGRQPWCNGHIGTVGASYGGLTQWLSAPLRSQYLKAMAPRVTPSDFWREDNYFGGAFALGLNLHWALSTSSRSMQNAEIYDWDQVYWSLPLIDADRQAGRDVKFYQDWLKHPTYDDYWRQISNHDNYGSIDVPILNLAGWFDAYHGAAFINYAGMVKQGRSEMTRRSQKLVIGPWPHNLAVSTRTGQLDFGPASKIDLLALELRWFDHWLKKIDTGIMDEPPIRLFVMGANVWRNESNWPPEGTRFTRYYLHSRGGASRLPGDGTLSPEPPEEEATDEYDYDPSNPVPTLGGNHSMTSDVVPVGPWDQRPIEGRSDVLVYTSPTLMEDVEVTGPVVATLCAGSSATDTDFTARLVDVYPDGRAMNLCEGVLRTRYRDSFENPTLMEPGRVYELRIDMEVTSNVFKRGHRIRLDVSSSNFPRLDRNLNTGRPIGMDAEMQVAHQTIYHTREYPSYILLPIASAGVNAIRA
jgi:putative CocE/NonD family hydrolase